MKYTQRSERKDRSCLHAQVAGRSPAWLCNLESESCSLRERAGGPDGVGDAGDQLGVPERAVA